jgi:hypothetical protein
VAVRLGGALHPGAGGGVRRGARGSGGPWLGLGWVSTGPSGG